MGSEMCIRDSFIVPTGFQWRGCTKPLRARSTLTWFYETTDRMCADIYTKAFPDKAKWNSVCQLINVVEPSSFPHLVKSKEKKSEGAKAPAGVSLVRCVEEVDFVSPGPPLMTRGCPSVSRGGILGRLRQKMLRHPAPMRTHLMPSQNKIKLILKVVPLQR